MGFQSTVILSIAIVIFALGLLVVARQYKARINQSFFLLTTFTALWVASNNLAESANTIELNDLFNRLAFSFGLAAMVFTAIFTIVFSNRKKINRAEILTLFIGITGSIASYHSAISGSVRLNNEKLIFGAGDFLIIYALIFLGLIIVVIYNLRIASASKNITIKRQSKYLRIGLLFTIFLSVITSVIIPLIYENWDAAPYGPLSTLLFVVMFTYLIIKHRLFSFRAVLARSATYLLVFTSFIGLYLLAAFGILEAIFEDSIPAIEQISLALVSLVLAFGFNYLKRFFNVATSRIFFRNSYDSQESIDKIGDVIVSTIEQKQLVEGIENVLSSTLAPSKVEVVLKNNTNVFAEISKRMLQTEDSIVSADDIGGSMDLYDYLQESNFFVVSKLIVQGDCIGYLVLGHKKNGGLYSQKDIKFVNTISNEIGIALQNSQRYEEIKELNESLEKKIEKATKELKSSNERLVKLDEAKDEFISMASHQLRTPLTSVKGYISMVLEGDMGRINPEQAKMLDQAYISSQRMVYLIADLLNVSRLRTGKFIIEQRPTNLANLIEGEISQLHETAAARKLKIIYKKPKNFPDLCLDETKTRQVVMNFVDNAIYYTNPGDTITISLKATDKTVTCEIIDTGIGVPKKDIPNLFRKFYRADNAKKARPDGTGLGLYMAKKVVIAQGGSIIFKSKEGKGSTFGFTLNRKKLETKKSSKK